MSFHGQWADSLLAFERAFAAKLALWALASILVGSALLAWIRLRALASSLLRHFALQSLLWASAILLFALWTRRAAELRDLAGVTALDRSVWFGLGFEVGLVALGAGLATAGWLLGRRLGLVGAGVAIVVQALALSVLQLQFASTLIR